MTYPLPSTLLPLHRELRDILQRAGIGPEQSQAEAQWMIEAATDLTQTHLYSHPDTPVSPQTLATLGQWLHRRLTHHEPLHYIMGYTYFYGRRFQCSPAALIPRPETEMIIDWVIDTLSSVCPSQPCHLLDIGTGSGCIAITLALELALKLNKQHPQHPTHITAMEPCADALALAQRNATLLEATHLSFVQHDVFTAPSPHTPYTGIVSNPPYINTPDYNALPPHIRHHEPKRALHADHNGLAFYQYFAKAFPQWLAPNGFIACEFANGQETDLIALFQSHGWHNVEIHNDAAGLPRMLTATRP